MNNQQILDFLLLKKAKYEEQGLIPTLELLIEELQEENTTIEHGYTPSEDETNPAYEDYSGASDTLTDFNNR